MEKIWYVKINEKKEGPYSFDDLKNDSRITPDTLAWKPGFPIWVPIGYIPELKKIFSDDQPSKGIEEPTKNGKLSPGNGGDITLALREEPPFLFFWIVIAVIVICYVLYQLYGLQ